MKKIQKLFVLVISVALFSIIFVISAFAEITASGTCGENVTWTLYDDGLLEISGDGEMYDYLSSTSPLYNYRSEIREIIIAEGVTSIGNSVFLNCSMLTSLTIPQSITSINDFEFHGCTSLMAIEVDENNEYYCDVEGVLFSKDQKTIFRYPAGKTDTEYTIPDSTTSIGDSAFFACSALTSVTIPDSVTSIGKSAFSYCSALVSVTVPDSVTSIGAETFVACSSLTSATISNNITSIEGYLFWNCHSLTSLTIPNSVTKIGYYAFRGCNLLKSINIPGNITKIGGWAFFGCSELTNIYIPNNVTSIGEYAFFDCTKLETVTINNYESAITIENFAFSSDLIVTFTMLGGGKCGENVNWTLYSDGLLEISGSGEMTNYTSSNYAPWYSYNSKISTVIIGDGVTSIGAWSFVGCHSLTSIDIPNSVTRIKELAFNSCGFTSVEIPNSVTYIGNQVFAACYNLTSVKLPNGISSISTAMFRSCYKLISVDIPNGVTSIGYYAFEFCHNLTSVTIPEGVESIGGSAFSGCSNLANITIPDSVITIGERTFENCSALESIIIPDNVTSISKSCFSSCSALTSVTIGNGVTSIDEWAFNYCNSLKNVNIPSGITSIGTGAFFECSNLISINIPNSVTSIGEIAFKGCSALVAINVDDNNSAYCDINDVLFSKDKKILIKYPARKTDIEYIIPDNVISIYSEAFKNNDFLTSVVIPDSVTFIGDSVFDNCASLVRVTIGNGIKDISNWAFIYCKSLTSLTVPDGVTSIGYLSFYECSSLKSVTIPKSVTSIDASAFRNCPALTIHGHENTVAEKYANSNGIAFIAFGSADYTDDGNELEYPIYNEENFAAILRDWIEASGYSELFEKYLETHSYSDLLEMTINMPMFKDNGKGIILEGTAKVKECIAYILFVEEAQIYFDKVNSKVIEHINNGNRDQAYSYFLGELKNFQSQFYYFQESLNGKDAFASTLNQLLMARVALSAVDMLKVTLTTGEVEYVNLNKEGLTADEYKNKYSSSISHTVPLKSYHYITDMYAATVTESPELYDDVMYYIMSGGDDQYLNKNYQTTLEGVGLLLKDSKKLFEVSAEDYDLGGDVGSLIGIGLDNITFFAEAGNSPYADKVKTTKKYWESAKTAYDFVKSVYNFSLGGVVTSTFEIGEAYIKEITKVYDNAANAEAGWYALMYYHLGKTDEAYLKKLIDPNTGAAYFDFSRGTIFGPSGKDVITDALAISWQEKAYLAYSYTPDENYRMYLLKASQDMINIEALDTTEVKNMLIEYILAELNRQEGNMGVYLDVNAKSSDSTLGKVTGKSIATFGEEVVLTASPYTNCTFTGWVDADTGETLSDSDTYTFMATKSVDVVASFVAGEVEKATTPSVSYDFSDTQYYIGDTAKELSVSALANDSGAITISWYRNTKNSTTGGTWVGSGNTITPSTETSGTYYYYAVVKNTLKYTVGTQTTTTTAQKTTGIVKIEVSNPYVVSVEITNSPEKTTYYIGDAFDTQGMTVTVTWSNKKTTVEDDPTVSYDFSSMGVKAVTVDFLGVADELEVVVFDPELLKFDGYQVRNSDYNGLRSIFILDLNKMPNINDAGLKVVECGTVMASTEKLIKNGDELTVSKNENGFYDTLSYAVIVPIIKNDECVGTYLSKDENQLKYACTVTNYDINTFDKKIDVRGYVVFEDVEGNEYVVYSDYPSSDYRSVSLADICDGLVQDGMVTEETCISYAHVVKFRKERE